MQICEKSSSFSQIITFYLSFKKRLLDAAPQQYQVDPFAHNTSPAPVPMPSPAYNNMNTTPGDEFVPKEPSYSDISDQVSNMMKSTLICFHANFLILLFPVVKILLNYSSPQNQTSPTLAPVSTIAQGNPFDQAVSSIYY